MTEKRSLFEKLVGRVHLDPPVWKPAIGPHDEQQEYLDSMEKIMRSYDQDLSDLEKDMHEELERVLTRASAVDVIDKQREIREKYDEKRVDLMRRHSEDEVIIKERYEKALAKYRIAPVEPERMIWNEYREDFEFIDLLDVSVRMDIAAMLVEQGEYDMVVLTNVRESPFKFTIRAERADGSLEQKFAYNGLFVAEPIHVPSSTARWYLDKKELIDDLWNTITIMKTGRKALK